MDSDSSQSRCSRGVSSSLGRCGETVVAERPATPSSQPLDEFESGDAEDCSEEDGGNEHRREQADHEQRGGDESSRSVSVFHRGGAEPVLLCVRYLFHRILAKGLHPHKHNLNYISVIAVTEIFFCRGPGRTWIFVGREWIVE